MHKTKVLPLRAPTPNGTRTRTSCKISAVQLRGTTRMDRIQLATKPKQNALPSKRTTAVQSVKDQPDPSETKSASKQTVQSTERVLARQATTVIQAAVAVD